MFIMSSEGVDDYINLHKYFNYVLPISSYNSSKIVGVMTSNIYLKADNTSYNAYNAIHSHLNFSFIQDLIQVDWKVQGYFNRSNGILLYLNINQTESLWIFPEIMGMLIIWASIIAFYELLRRNIQDKFDLKQDLILKSQAKIVDNNLTEMEKENDFRLEKYPTTMNKDEFNNSNSETDEDEKDGKKMSWEEYKKLEEKE